MTVFKWLSRRGREEKPQATASRDRVADAVVEFDSLGRLSEEDLEGGATPGPAPEYIQEATEPSPEAWEHEREARDRIERDRGDS